MHCQSLELLHRFHNVLLMYCTYKTNKYDLSVLNFVGITNVGTSFYAGFAFLWEETTFEFRWALRVFLDASNVIP